MGSLFSSLWPLRPFRSFCTWLIRSFWSKKRTSPTKQYLNVTSIPSIILVQPSPKLIILDLNGTLVFRKKTKKTRKVTLRPFLKEFIDYLFTDGNFLVMVWTTARPENTKIMVDLIFENQKEKLIAIWSRDKFGLSKREYERHTVPFKDLDMVWNYFNSQIANGNLSKNTLKNSSELSTLDPTNTVLIDDSRFKTQLQPFNAIHPCEFDLKCSRNGDDSELKKIIKYLEVIKYQSNVAAYMKDNPFSVQEEIAGK
ncbi:hypothetical protein RclHR1_01010011 [Rhizophagus clarus]|uniref:Mitochondrial import inner membrane translocase subunit TIM50 n=1 Tax=Rhizophagus clarus TaxID=94130 RepID=A0A2Z6Q0Q5_9GLOM|nr:hypothetical protein RclHR1_01010011 [Rhizophagus clarus]GES82954.1 HAD-like protein [Rhizophagus clarus]